MLPCDTLRAVEASTGSLVKAYLNRGAGRGAQEGLENPREI